MRQTGTSDNYRNLLEQLRQIATSEHIATAVVNNPGTGGTYVVGDVLTVSGGTGTHAATILVLGVTAGQIDDARILDGGAYSAPPSSPVSVTGGGGTGATFDTTEDGPWWTELRATQQAVSATVGAGGSGYSVGNDITVVGGLGVGTAAVFNVDSVSGGAVTAVSLVTAGSYEGVPTNPAATTGGAGTGATLNVTWESALDDQEGVLILEGEGAGSDQIFVGIRSYNLTADDSINTVRNWALAGFTGYSSVLTFNGQPGISPEHPASSSSGGAIVPLKTSDAFDMQFWFYITARKIVGVVRTFDASVDAYPSFHLGWLDQAGTQVEFPYPIYIAGATSKPTVYWRNTVGGRISGLVEAIGSTAADDRPGPGFYRKADGNWQECKNSMLNDAANNRTQSRDATIYPMGQTIAVASLATEDQIVADGVGFTWDDVFPPTGIPGTPTVVLQPTEEASERYLIPATLCLSTSGLVDLAVIGELHGVYSVTASPSGAVGAEDTITDDAGDVYRVFPNGNKFEDFSFLAIKET